MNAVLPDSLVDSRHPSYAVEHSGGRVETVGEGPPRFTIVLPGRSSLAALLNKDGYSAALAFLRGEFSIRGELPAAIRFYWKQSHSRTAQWLAAMLAKLMHSRPVSWLRSRRTADQIQYHYDRSNEFYEQFLDRRMVYSCAYFRDAAEPLEDAQSAKLDLICRKLDLQPGDRLLDIGCGWGGLLLHAAGSYGAIGTGYTLSHNQAVLARDRVARAGLDSVISIREADYRDVTGPFTKVASVGMFEHVGPHHLAEYFQRVHAVLAPGGLFLNHGIVRPEGQPVAPESLFLDRKVFPGADLVPIAEVIRQASLAGFEVLDVENLRPHYVLTCRAWMKNLQDNEERCRQLVGDETYRTWLLYLAASAVNFDDGNAEVHQVLFAKRGENGRHWLTRDFRYRGSLAGHLV